MNKRIASRRSKRQTLLRLAPADQERLRMLAHRDGLPQAETVARLIYQAVPGKLSDEAQALLAYVQTMTTPPAGTTDQERAAFDVHRLAMEQTIRRANGLPDLMTWGRLMATWTRLVTMAGRRAGEAAGTRAPAGPTPRLLTYEEHLGEILRAQEKKTRRRAPRATRRDAAASTTTPAHPAISEPEPRPTPAAPDAAAPRTPGGQGLVGSRDPQTGNFPVQDAERAARDGHAGWL